MATQQSIRFSQSRSGFTLIEMLISVALVLLMMTMFAQIFSAATASVAKQRVISENDQKARSLSTVIRGDVAKRTFTNPFPFYPNEDSATSPTEFGNRAGYIYINTNDPASYSDDVLQFTVDSRLITENTDTSRFTGKAASLDDPADPIDQSIRPLRLSTHYNQPTWTAAVLHRTTPRHRRWLRFAISFDTVTSIEEWY